MVISESCLLKPKGLHSPELKRTCMPEIRATSP